MGNSMHKILVIEDDPILREMYTRVLAQEDYKIETAENGEQALQLMLKYKPDLILLDLMLPNITGFDVLKKIKTDISLKGVKVIILTNIFPDKQDLFAQGADSIMIKSDSTPGQILDKIHTLLRGK